MAGVNSRLLVSRNPFNGRVQGSWPGQTETEILHTADSAESAFRVWSLTTPGERSATLEALARLVEHDREKLAGLMAREMGKPYTQGLAEADKCASVCRYYASNAGAFLRDSPRRTEARKSYVRYEPLGVVFGIMPWNFPFWQVFRFAAPAVAAGNGILLKHSPCVTGCALEIASLFRRAGFPEGLPGVLLIPGREAGKVSRMLIHHPSVKAVTFTGSTRAGRAVAREAGSALKKCVLELGGSDPAIVLADADLVHAARMIAHSRLLNAGQNCIASKRIIVEEPVSREFIELLVKEMQGAVMGDPMDRATVLGPMARPDLRMNLHRQVTESAGMGARILTGGVIPDGTGYFYPPTVLDRSAPGMPVADEETFGPVAAVITVLDQGQAVEIAGATPFGLGASVFTGDTGRGESLAGRIRAGSCFVNTFVRSDPRLPFGGTGGSGYGRELSSEGLMEFVNLKTVWVE